METTNERRLGMTTEHQDELIGLANINLIKAQTIQQLVLAGFSRERAAAAAQSGDMSVLVRPQKPSSSGN
jgi:hypothetical protein